MPAGARADEASRLESLLERRLAELARPGTGGWRLAESPDLGVRAEGGQYRITLPHLRLLTPGGWMVEAVDVQAMATRRGQDWQIAAALPTPLAVFDAEGVLAGRITLGEQNFLGRWTADLRTLTGLDAGLRHLRFTPREGEGGASLDRLTATMKPDSYAAGRWSGPMDFSLSGLEVRDDDGRETLALDRLTAQIRLKGLDVAKYAAWNAAMARRAAADDGREGLTQAERGALQAALPSLDGLLSAANAAIAVEGYRSRTEDGTVSVLGQARLALDASGLDGPRSRLSLDHDHSGLSVAGPRVTRRVIPATGKARVSAASVPLREILEAARDRLTEEPELGVRAARERFEQRTLEALGRAGTQVRLDGLTLEAPEAGAGADAALTFDGEMPRGLSGGLSLALRGVDALIQQVAGGKENPGAALGLYALQGMGRAETDSRGRPIRTYRFEIGADGRILLNGADVTSLITGLLSLR